MTKKKLLIVDDSKANIDILLNFLRDDFNLVPARSGQKALSILERLEFDLVLLDIMMPDMNGYEVVQAMQTNEKLKTLPVIFVTASQDEELITQAKQLGIKDTLVKPFDKQELFHVLNQYLNEDKEGQ